MPQMVVKRPPKPLEAFEMQFKSLSDHRDDIVFQHQVKEACKVLLSYYMIPSEAAGYIEDVEESN